MEELCNIVIFNRRSDTMHEGYAVLWEDLTFEQARAICCDPRTEGANHFLGWIYKKDCMKWFKVKDDGRYQYILDEILSKDKDALIKLSI